MESDFIGEAIAHHSAGRIDAAVPLYRQVLDRDPQHADANHFLGIILLQHGHAAEAAALFARATTSARATPEMYNNYGVALRALGEPAQATAAFAQAIAKRPDYAEAWNNLGTLYKDAGRTMEAVAAFRRAVEIQPDYAVAQGNLRNAYGDVIPAWHFAMMNDSARNAAYDRALRSVVPGRRVLDIGTGAGLLAMMSARADAASVTSCEKVEVIADHARQVVKLNRLSDRIVVVGLPSTELKIGRDLPERAEILVTETFSSGLLGEGVLPTLEHAHAELLVPGAVVIPRAASAFGYLIGGKPLRDKLFVDTVADFDLTPFADFAPIKIGLCLDHEPHEVLSNDVELMRFTLTDQQFPAASAKISIPVVRSGICVGVAQWLKLELDAETSYENRPSPEAAGATWAHIIYGFPAPILVRAGDVVHIEVLHDRLQLTINLLA